MALQTIPAEHRDYADRLTGVRVRQLTNHRAHSHHLYFTNPGWWDGGRRLVFGSDRGNATNLYSLELATGAITQLTGFGPEEDHQFQLACLNPTRPEAYFADGREIVALHLETGALSAIGRMPDGFVHSMLNVTVDGKLLCAGAYEDLSDRVDLDLGHGYVGFAELFEAGPLGRLLTVPTDGGDTTTVWEERAWIGHCNTSPARPDLLTFCHEGPWDRVDCRIWGFDLRGGEPWKIRPAAPGERVGHEYWLADGETVAFHGVRGDKHLYGFVRYDNTGLEEAELAHHSTHFHSNDRGLIVGDGQPGGVGVGWGGGGKVLLWRYDGTTFEGPRVLCVHHSSMHIQQTHVHPRLSPDGTQVLFTSDMSGYGNLYLADLPEFDSLPLLP